MESQQKKDLLQHFTSKSRKPALVGNKVYLPKVLDNEGEVRSKWASPDSVHQLNLKQAKFLQEYDKTQDLDKACLAADADLEWGKKFLKRHQGSGGYYWELDKLKQLSAVATPEWTKAKAVQGVTGEWQPTKSQVECLKLVKDINYPKAAANIQINNVLQMPTLRPDQEAAFRALADNMADAEMGPIQ